MTEVIGVTRELLPGAGVAEDIAALYAGGADRVIAATSREDGRRELDALVSGDTVVVTEGARLARTANEFTAVVAGLVARGVELRVLAEPSLSTGTTVNPGDVLVALHALRSRLLSLQVRAGMEAAAAAGRRPGRPLVMTPEQVEIARELRGQQRSYANIARVLKVSPSAVQRALRSAKA